MQVFVLLRQFEPRDTDSEPPEVRVLAVYESLEGLEARVDRIAKANAVYPLQRLSELRWRIGPEEDEGFFGNRPVEFWAVKIDTAP
jgi:hypothetical protein